MATALHEVGKHPNSSPRPKPAGWDEIHLAAFPFSTCRHQQQANSCGNKEFIRTFRSKRWDKYLAGWVPQTVILKSNSEDGLPTPLDESVFVALFNLAQLAELDNPRFRFVPNKLFNIMRWAPRGDSYDRLQASLRRLKALTIIYNNSWWDKHSNEYEVELSLGLISSYQYVRPKDRRRSNATAKPNWVRFDEEFYQRLKNGVIKPLDLHKFFSLRRPISRRMYRVIDAKLYQRTSFDVDLEDFAFGNIGLPDTYTTGIIKQKLSPAIDELVEHEIIEAATKTDRYTKIKPGVWRIHFERKLNAKGKTSRKASHSSISSITAQLIERGITTSAANKLVDKYPAVRIIKHVEIFDWYADQHSQKKPGWLRKAIEEDYSIPDNFKSRAQKQSEKRSQARRQATERRERKIRDDRIAQEQAELKQLEDKYGPLFDELSQPEKDRCVEAVMQRVYPTVIGSPIENTTRNSDDVRKRCLRDLADTLSPPPSTSP